MCCPRVEVFWMPLRMERMNSLARCFLFLASPRRHRQNQIRLDFGRWNGTMVDQREMISSQTPRLSIIFDHFDVIPFIQLWKWGRRSSDSRRLIQRPFHSHSQSLLPLTYGFHHRITPILLLLPPLSDAFHSPQFFTIKQYARP